jgi:drug/metabolite transporter (DMT)-like permease
VRRRRGLIVVDLVVFWAVLAAAFLHAGWNALVKVGLDRFLSIVLLGLVQSAIAILLIPFFPLPSAASWPWIVASAALHTGYKLFLIRAYAHGDLSQVYPLARGTAPLIVAIIGALWLGETVTVAKAAAIAAIGLGVILMALKGGTALSRIPPKALLYALCTAGFTAAYTVVDGVGARLSGTASGYTLWMFALDGLAIGVLAFAMRGPAMLAPMLGAWKSGVLAGVMSLAAYWIAIWGFTKAPIALVAALRETSVLFALLIAAIAMREPVGPWRWGAAGLIVTGVVLMRL